MNGLTLARDYYLSHRETLLAPFAECRQRVAVGLVGFGSDCFGYDDHISMDHDFGPGFCLWLTDDDRARFGAALQAQYQSLPATHAGFNTRRISARAGKRVGVFSIGEFYSQFLGAPQLPVSDADWLQIPEELLATAVNGDVFEDRLGEFSQIRESLLAYYPPSVQRLKLGTAVARMAQSGQYNLPRALQRQALPVACMAQAEFIRHACGVAHILGKRYAPFYKWLHRSVRDLPVLPHLYTQIERLCEMPIQAAPPIVEEICADVLRELVHQGYTRPGEAFLEAHVDTILNHAG